MPLTIFTGSANVPLAAAVAEQLGVSLGSRRVHRFPDGELQEIMERSFHAVHETAARERVGMRLAAQMLAIQRVVQAILDRGVYP